jgi:ATP synthase protein I
MTKRENETGDDEALRARLGRLSTALDAQRKDSQERETERDATNLSGQSVGSAMSLGFRVLTEFVVAVVVGALIGWQVDVWLGTAPLLLITFLALGTAAGFWNVYRIAVPKPKRQSPSGQNPSGQKDGMS